MGIERIGVVPFSVSQRARFRTGDLPREWAKHYRDLFDEDDLRLAISQPDYHFFEWLGAVILFNSTGYLSLVEKYEFGKHARKSKIIRQIVPPEVLTLMCERTKGGRG